MRTKLLFTLFLFVSLYSCNNTQNRTKQDNTNVEAVKTEKDLPNERTFDNCYKVEKGEKIPYKITIRKSLDKYTVIFYTDKKSEWGYISTKDLELHAQSIIEQGDYWYWGRYLDNSGDIGSIKIRTYRPLEDFIANGVASDKKMNIMEHSDVYNVQLFGSTKFEIGDNTHTSINENNHQSNNQTLSIDTFSTMQITGQTEEPHLIRYGDEATYSFFASLEYATYIVEIKDGKGFHYILFSGIDESISWDRIEYTCKTREGNHFNYRTFFESAVVTATIVNDLEKELTSIKKQYETWSIVHREIIDDSYGIYKQQ